MKAQEERGLTDNAWVERIGQLRQLVSDDYDTSLNITPREFVDYAVENYEEDFDDADIRIMLRHAEQMRDEWDKMTAA